MKIAFCFLTRDDVLQPAVWDRFFAGAPQALYNVYCHAKFPDRIGSPILKDRVIKDLVPTSHADVSIVDATIRLFAAAHDADPDNQYFILLSESTIPLVPFHAIRAELERCQSRSIISFSVPAPDTEHYRRSLAVADQKIFSAAFYFHDQWIVLHRRHVRLLMERSFLHLFDKVFAPDEHYFLNVLAHPLGVPLDQFISRRVTFVNWRDREEKLYRDRTTGRIVARTVHPKTYRTLPDADLAAARRDRCWFFRKVDAACDCRAVLDALGA
jgi:hypothetical protein